MEKTPFRHKSEALQFASTHDFNIDNQKGKGLEPMKIIFIVNLKTFGSNVFLTLKIILNFENVALTKFVHIYVIEGMNA